jgi:hypothetical protein
MDALAVSMKYSKSIASAWTGHRLSLNIREAEIPMT